MSKDAKAIALDFVRFFCEQICEHVSDISLNSADDEKGTLIQITVNEVDMGRLIGKDGQTISALRLLVRNIGSRENQKIALKVL